MEALMEWAKSQGVECARLLLGGLDGREMVAVEDLPAGSCFLRIPQHLLLRAELALQDPVYGKALTALAAEAGPSLDERFLMCLLMIIERCKGESSLWGPFLAVLPRTYEDPFWWADEELQLLKGTRVGNTVEYYNKGLQNLRTWRARLVDLHRELSGGQGPDVLSTGEGGWGMSEDAIKWAKSSVWSRAFNIPYLGAVGRPGIAMLPVADMLNHRPSQHVAWHTGPDGNQPFAFITHTPVPKGGTLYSNYGYKSNEELLVGYGFILDSNPANFFHVSLALENVARPVAEEEDGEQEQMSTSALTAPQRAPAWQAWWTSRLATSSSPAERAHPEAVLASHEVQCAAVMETPGVACGRVLTEAGSGTPVGLAASLGVPVEWCGWAWGLEVTRDVQQGAVLASLPASACLTAPDALALTGHGALVRHLAARVASSFAARLGLGGAMSDSIAELLEGSPAESLLQDECSDLQQRFAVVQPLLQAAIQEAAPGLAATSADGGPDGVLSVAQETLFGLMCWADVVIERCSFACIGAVAVAPVVSALPPALRGVAAEICWEESSESVQLVACCALPSGTVLNEALLNVGADAETLLVAYGPEAVAHAALLAKDVSIPDYLGGCMYEDGYELCIAVPESDQLHAEKTELLMASTLGSSHWLCASASPELLLAAIALIAAEAETLQAAGAQELLEALQACSSVAGRQSDGAAPASDACTPDAVQGQAGPRARDEAAINAAETRLAVAQQSFVMALLTGKASRKVACKQCRALLAASREELPDDSGSTTGIAQATVTQHFRQALTAEAAHDEGNLMLYGLFLYRKGLASLLDKAIATLTSSSSKHSGSQGSVKRKKRRH
ncbi:hypothetical protein WJX72_001533 [[Myrmecia] bisecta]|uniref:SET domain-containing protein n=1 Tax=[Myrmecia] bisecta TaxID=41462 RepID=A0AAW1QQD5_9CHLO